MLVGGVAARRGHCRKDCKADVDCLAHVPSNRSCQGEAEKRCSRCTQRAACRGLVRLCKGEPGHEGACVAPGVTTTTIPGGAVHVSRHLGDVGRGTANWITSRSRPMRAATSSASPLAASEVRRERCVHDLGTAARATGSSTDRCRCGCRRACLRDRRRQPHPEVRRERRVPAEAGQRRWPATDSSTAPSAWRSIRAARTSPITATTASSSTGTAVYDVGRSRTGDG